MGSFQFDENLYQQLSSNYFNVLGVPQPLVLKSWLSKLETEVEDEINLAIVAQRIRAKNETVNRGRGRPKKKRDEESSIRNSVNQLSEWIPSNDIDSTEIRSDSNSLLNFGQEEDSSGEESLNNQKPEKSIDNNGRCGFTCLLCNKTFKSQSTLKYHSRIHR